MLRINGGSREHRGRYTRPVSENTASNSGVFPRVRPRRLRRSPTLRAMVRQTHLAPHDLILPLFAISGTGREEQIVSLPGAARQTPDLLAARAKTAFAAGVPSVLLFGIPETKDPQASSAYADDGVVQNAVRAIKDAAPDMVVVTDVCLCAYTDHGHCGVIHDGRIDNDASIELIAATAASHASGRFGSGQCRPEPFRINRGHNETPSLSRVSWISSS